MDKKICFTSSSGGHFNQLYDLMSMYKGYDNVTITEKTNFSERALDDEKKYFFNTINRNEKTFLLKFFIYSIKIGWILLKERPQIIISTGALITVPVCYIGKLLGAKVIFVESFAKVETPTLSGKLVYKIADRVIVQWKELLDYYKNDGKVIYGGTIY